MATHLASIYGTEHDKVNCAFYHKIGACRHGDKCSRKHVKPAYSQTILCRNLYQDPSLNPSISGNEAEETKYFLNFFIDIFAECSKYGHVEEMVVCENNNDHLTGNVYCRFRYEDDASKAMEAFNRRWYDNRPVYCELSPVTEFSEACCRQHESKECKRGRFCNFMHARSPPRELFKRLKMAQKKKQKMGKENHQQQQQDRDVKGSSEREHKPRSDSDSKGSKSGRSKRDIVSRDYTDSEAESDAEISHKRQRV